MTRPRDPESLSPDPAAPQRYHRILYASRPKPLFPSIRAVDSVSMEIVGRAFPSIIPCFGIIPIVFIIEMPEEKKDWESYLQIMNLFFVS